LSTNQAYLKYFVKIGPNFVGSAVIRGNDYGKKEVLSIMSTAIKTVFVVDPFIFMFC
jgi:hypothetical protein